MAWLRIATGSLCLLLVTACTTTPDKFKNLIQTKEQTAVSYNSASIQALNQAKADAVATALIGVPQVYIDQQLGTSVELVVQAEYFSANGRNCRRYSERVNGQSEPGISCEDDTFGWVDLPLSSFVR